jgi:hypothetical protein
MSTAFENPPRRQDAERRRLTPYCDVYIHDMEADGVLIVMEHREEFPLYIRFDFQACGNLTPVLAPGVRPIPGAPAGAAVCELDLPPKSLRNIVHLQVVDIDEGAYDLHYKVEAFFRNSRGELVDATNADAVGLAGRPDEKRHAITPHATLCVLHLQGMGYSTVLETAPGAPAIPGCVCIDYAPSSNLRLDTAIGLAKGVQPGATPMQLRVSVDANPTAAPRRTHLVALEPVVGGKPYNFDFRASIEAPKAPTSAPAPSAAAPAAAAVSSKPVVIDGAAEFTKRAPGAPSGSSPPPPQPVVIDGGAELRRSGPGAAAAAPAPAPQPVVIGGAAEFTKRTPAAAAPALPAPAPAPAAAPPAPSVAISGAAEFAKRPSGGPSAAAPAASAAAPPVAISGGADMSRPVAAVAPAPSVAIAGGADLVKRPVASAAAPSAATPASVAVSGEAEMRRPVAQPAPAAAPAAAPRSVAVEGGASKAAPGCPAPAAAAPGPTVLAGGAVLSKPPAPKTPEAAAEEQKKEERLYGDIQLRKLLPSEEKDLAQAEAEGEAEAEATLTSAAAKDPQLAAQLAANPDRRKELIKTWKWYAYYSRRIFLEWKFKVLVIERLYRERTCAICRCYIDPEKEKEPYVYKNTHRLHRACYEKAAKCDQCGDILVGAYVTTKGDVSSGVKLHNECIAAYKAARRPDCAKCGLKILEEKWSTNAGKPYHVACSPAAGSASVSA